MLGDIGEHSRKLPVTGPLVIIFKILGSKNVLKQKQ